MTFARAAALAALSTVSFAALSAQQPETAAPAEPPPVVVPVHQEPHHRQVFQFGPTRILDLQIPPKDISLFHSHEWPVLYVTLSTSATRTQVLGQDWGGRGARAGGAAGQARGAAPPPGRATPPAGTAAAAPRATSTTSYVEMPVTHRLENTGTGLFRAMVVINETAGDDTTTEQMAGFEGKPELTNKWFRAYRIALAPGEKTPPHRHRAPVAIIQATAGKGLGAGAMKWEFNEPGQWAFFDSNDPHDVQNLGADRIELIEVEVRRR